VGPLLKALKDEDTDVRRETVESLGLVGSSQAVQPLLPFLKDKDDATRRATIEALGRIGQPSAVDALAEMATDKSAKTRKAVVVALEKIGSDKVLPPLKILLKDSDPELRIAAAIVVGEVGGKQAQEMLLPLKYDQDEAGRRVYPVAAWMSKSPYTFEQLRAALGSEHEHEQLGAYILLMKLDTPEAAALIESSKPPAVDAAMRRKIDYLWGQASKQMALPETNEP
jgi:HEAT repeat protein